ncbi:MAG: DNA-binding domain-containing protein [Verrucomicrobiales bacterium]
MNAPPEPSPPAATSSDGPDLGRVQRWMLAVVTHPDGIDEGADAAEARRWIDAGAGQLESVVTRSRRLSASERLAIYGNAYYARLLDCLGEVFPVLRRTLGEDVFNGFAFDYLQACPSRTYTLNHLGREFPDYLRRTRPATQGEAGENDDWAEFLIDLARLEWTIYDVFDGPGMEGGEAMELPDFAAMEQGNWIDLVFRPAPCLRLLEFTYPVNAHFTEVRATDDELNLSFPEPGRHFVAISRRDYIVRRYPLSEAEFLLLGALAEGASLGDALERLLDALGDSVEELKLEESLPRWFQYWSAERCFFTGIEGSVD